MDIRQRRQELSSRTVRRAGTKALRWGRDKAGQGMGALKERRPSPRVRLYGRSAK